MKNFILVSLFSLLLIPKHSLFSNHLFDFGFYGNDVCTNVDDGMLYYSTGQDLTKCKPMGILIDGFNRDNSLAEQMGLTPKKDVLIGVNGSKFETLDQLNSFKSVLGLHDGEFNIKRYNSKLKEWDEKILKYKIDKNKRTIIKSEIHNIDEKIEIKSDMKGQNKKSELKSNTLDKNENIDENLNINKTLSDKCNIEFNTTEHQIVNDKNGKGINLYHADSFIDGEFEYIETNNKVHDKEIVKILDKAIAWGDHIFYKIEKQNGIQGWISHNNLNFEFDKDDVYINLPSDKLYFDNRLIKISRSTFRVKFLDNSDYFLPLILDKNIFKCLKNNDKYEISIQSIGIGKKEIQNGTFRGDLNEKLEPIKGEIIFKDKSIYNGEIKNSLPDGKGQLISKHLKYTGSFKEGKKHGEGEIEFDSIIYNKFNKTNRLFPNSNFKLNVVYENDLLLNERQFTVYFDNGNYFKGGVNKDFLLEGYGTVFNQNNNLIANGNFYEGNKTGLFVENKENAWRLIDHKTNIDFGITDYKICDPNQNKKIDCNDTFEIKFTDSINGQFFGKVNQSTGISEGHIIFLDSEYDYFIGNISIDKNISKLKFDGELIAHDTSFYRGNWSPPDYKFEGNYFDQFKNQIIYEYQIPLEITYIEDFEQYFYEDYFPNYIIKNNNTLEFFNDAEHNLIKENICQNKFYNQSDYIKEFKIFDFKDIDVLKYKKEYYTKLIKKFDRFKNNQGDYPWYTLINIGLSGNCYIEQYSNVISSEKMQVQKNKEYPIDRITKNFIILSNDIVIKRFMNDEIEPFENAFLKDNKNKIDDYFIYSILDYLYHQKADEFLNYYEYSVLKKDIQSQISIYEDPFASKTFKEKLPELIKELSTIEKKQRDIDIYNQKIFEKNLKNLTVNIINNIKIEANLPSIPKFSSIEEQITQWEKEYNEYLIQVEKDKKLQKFIDNSNKTILTAKCYEWWNIINSGSFSAGQAQSLFYANDCVSLIGYPY